MPQPQSLCFSCLFPNGRLLQYEWEEKIVNEERKESSRKFKCQFLKLSDTTLANGLKYGRIRFKNLSDSNQTLAEGEFFFKATDSSMLLTPLSLALPPEYIKVTLLDLTQEKTDFYQELPRLFPKLLLSPQPEIQGWLVTQRIKDTLTYLYLGKLWTCLLLEETVEIAGQVLEKSVYWYSQTGILKIEQEFSKVLELPGSKPNSSSFYRTLKAVEPK